MIKNKDLKCLRIDKGGPSQPCSHKIYLLEMEKTPSGFISCVGLLIRSNQLNPSRGGYT